MISKKYVHLSCKDCQLLKLSNVCTVGHGRNLAIKNSILHDHSSEWSIHKDFNLLQAVLFVMGTCINRKANMTWRDEVRALHIEFNMACPTILGT